MTASFLGHGLYEGTVWHHRNDPDYGFRQSVSMGYFNLDDLDAALDASPLLGSNGLSPAKFRRQDFFGDPSQPLAECVRDLVEEQLAIRPLGPVCVLANVRTWGWCFNPIVFYWCYDESGHEVAQVLGVTNTPWHEYHNYVIDRRTGQNVTELEKAHHVSPFFPMNLHYTIEQTAPHTAFSFSMHVFEGPTEIFTAGLDATKVPLNAKNLRTLLLRRPTQRVSLGIYARAAKLWRRGARYVPHPRKYKTVKSGERISR